MTPGHDRISLCERHGGYLHRAESPTAAVSIGSCPQCLSEMHARHFKSSIFQTPEEWETARKALETPLLESSDFLDVLVDILLEKDALDLKIPNGKWDYITKAGGETHSIAHRFQRMKARIIARRELGRGTGRTEREVQKAVDWARLALGARREGVPPRPRSAFFLVLAETRIHTRGAPGVVQIAYKAPKSIAENYASRCGFYAGRQRDAALRATRAQMNANGFFVDHAVEEAIEEAEILKELG